MSYPPTPPTGGPRPKASVHSILSETDTIAERTYEEFPEHLRPQVKPSQQSFVSQATVLEPGSLEKVKSNPEPEPWKSLATIEEGGELEGLKVDGDVLIVDFTGPDDPANPRNWSDKRKRMLTVIFSLYTFGSPFASSVIAPGVGKLSKEFGITNGTVGAMITSIFVLAFAIGPLVLGPLSEVFGRAIILQTTKVFFVIWNLVCGFAQSTAQLIVFRFFAGLGGSSPLTIVGSAIGDMYPPERRGKALAVFILMPSFGPVIGPLVGSWIAERTSWRWIFWSSTIFEVIVMVLGVLIVRETYPPVILERKAKRVRKILKERNTQSLPDGVIGFYAGVPIRTIKTTFEDTSRTMSQILAKALTRPFVIFTFEPIVQVLGTYLAFQNGILYLFLTTISTTFKIQYGQTLGISGLHYIALGVGLATASQVNGHLTNPLYVYLKKKYNGVGRPEFRLPAMVPGSIVLPIGLFLSGWAAEKHWHWIVYDIGLVLIGIGIILCFQSIQMYIIDAFALHSASALACLSFLRSIIGFGLPLAGPPMYSNLGYGIGNTVLAVLAIALGIPAPFIFWRYGERLRQASRHSKK